MENNLKALINFMRSRLREEGIENCELDVAVLIKEILDISRLEQITTPNKELTSLQISHIHAALMRRANHEPIAYIINKKEFWGRDFFVDQNVLIPRPETELIIEEALKEQFPLNRILDLGTGSGCLAITLALEFPNSSVIAVDIHEAALKVARQNSQKLGAENINFIQSNWLSDIPSDSKFELIVANPPYIEENFELPLSVKNFEPHSALFSGETGLQDYEIIAATLPKFCATNFIIMLEIGFNQSTAVSQIFAKHFSGKIKVIKDLAGKDRVIKIMAK